MKKIIKLSLIPISLLVAGSPIHDLMDHRLKGKSFGGTLNDNTASEDGLGILPLQNFSSSTDVNNELLVQTVFKRTLKSTTNESLKDEIKKNITLGNIGTIKDRQLLNNYGYELTYVPGSMNSCTEIKSNFPKATNGVYQFSNGFNAKCDMTTTGIELYNNNLASCNEIKTRFPSITANTTYILNSGRTVTCDMTWNGGGWTYLQAIRNDWSSSTTSYGNTGWKVAITDLGVSYSQARLINKGTFIDWWTGSSAWDSSGIPIDKIAFQYVGETWNTYRLGSVIKNTALSDAGTVRPCLKDTVTVDTCHSSVVLNTGGNKLKYLHEDESRRAYIGATDYTNGNRAKIYLDIWVR